MNRMIFVIFIILASILIAFQNCAPIVGDTGNGSSSDSQGVNDDSKPVEAACTERRRENVIAVRLPGSFGQGDRIREVVIDNLNFSLFEELRYNECDHSFENPDLITWTQNEDEALIEIVLNDELNDVFFNEDGSLKKGETFYYSYQVRVNWYETCESTTTTARASSASQQLGWELDETYIDENGCEVDLHEEYIDFYEPKMIQ